MLESNRNVKIGALNVAHKCMLSALGIALCILYT